MFSFKKALSACVLLLGAARAAAIITADDIISGIAAVDSTVVTFRDHIIAYNGGSLNETPFFVDLAAILTATTLLDTQSSLVLSNFSSSDSNSIVDYYVSSLGEDIPSTGKALLARKDVIVANGGGESTAVAQKTFQAGNDAFATKMKSRLTSEVEDFEEAAERIHEALQEGYEAFNSL